MNSSFNQTQQSNKKAPTAGSIEFGRLVMQLKRLERHPHSFGEAGTLTPSELHTIDAIGVEGGIPMNELASRLGVTKGAVSQLIIKLEQKKLVYRSSDPRDLRISLLYLTDLGKAAFQAHMELHLSFYEHLKTALDAQEIEVFERSIAKLNVFLQQLDT